MKSYKELSKHTFFHIGLVCFLIVTNIILAIVFPFSDKDIVPRLIIAGIVFPFLVYQIINSHRRHQRFCARMAKGELSFDELDSFPKQQRRCYTCGTFTTCIDWCYHWRCKECYTGFNRFWAHQPIRA